MKLGRPTDEAFATIKPKIPEGTLQHIMRRARGSDGYWTRIGIVWAICQAYAEGAKSGRRK